ncbi:Wzz/FepE/Etk N-terminal domain-containing protein [Planococcus maritimus]|nr:Wzz/FepE/Etk N-terminal domain-containing protein [Planococcus sp. SK3692]MDE4086029.1 Wzz/FepE/Etk N-terminal domain-containing protein [Planococcus maritimus]
MESTFNMKEFFKNLKKRLPLIIAMTVAFVAIAAAVSYLWMKPVYQASTQILVNKAPANAQEFSMQDIDTNLQLISTYNVIIKSPAILTEVINELGLNEAVQSLNERIEVSSIEDSQVVTLEVEDGSMQQAVLIANTTAKVFEQEIRNLMRVDNVSILAPATMPASPEPVKPDPLFNMAIGAIIGFMLGTGLAIVLDQLNTTVRTEEDIDELLGLQVLGVVSPVGDLDRTDKSSKHTDRMELDENVEPDSVKTAARPKVGSTY